ncbi:SGNH/GDSL hydrolase family protein [Agromyces neolithicus]|uniref:SGNH/GDSL hydrolase family protein n=1 Tax=Agromyces neolithicus TaxID=269420 RepID=A0ABP4YGJ5_9MICO
MISTPITADLIHGIAELEITERGVRPHRLPEWVRRQFPDAQLMAMESQPSGARLAVRTTATTIELVTHAVRIAYQGADRPRGCIDVLVDGQLFLHDLLDGGDVIERDLQTGTATFRDGNSHTTTMTGLLPHEKLVEIWLPYNETLDLVSLHSDAPLAAHDAQAPVWMHHGSSISHGTNAASPTEIWPVIAARAAGVELHNLGFGGNSLIDPFVARVIRDRPADMISVKLGINIVNIDAMRLRAFTPAVHGFLDTIRDGHPDTPLLLVSPIYSGIHETTPGPAAVDPASLGTEQVRFIATGDPADVAHGRLTLEVIRRELAGVVEQRADPNLYYLDGTTLYGETDAAVLPLPDALHPDNATHHLIGQRFAELVFANQMFAWSDACTRVDRGT